MSFDANILADSMSPDGVRLTTMEITFPRIILAELNTHRMLSKSSASSRAIPVEKMIRRVLEDPYVPSSWGKNQKGMVASEDIDPENALRSQTQWLLARDAAVSHARNLLDIGIHKQTTNRLLEPFMWHTVIVTATEWSNFFHLRNNAQAHPDMQTIARMMQALYEDPARTPEPLKYGEWHLPLVGLDEIEAWIIEGLPNSPDIQPELLAKHAVKYDFFKKISAGRCARTSYLTHDGKRDLSEDNRLHDDLLRNGHMAPLEHVARPATEDDDVFMMCKANQYGRTGPTQQWSGNLRGWVQYRKTIPYEWDILATPR